MQKKLGVFLVLVSSIMPLGQHFAMAKSIQADALANRIGNGHVTWPIDDLAIHSFHCLDKRFPHSGFKGPTPVFAGCYDYHSAVHAYWALVRYIRIANDSDINSPLIKKSNQKIHQLLTSSKLKEEFEFLKENPSFEMPYGLGWLLRLSIEYNLTFETKNNPVAVTLTAIADWSFHRLKQYYSTLNNPIDEGSYLNSAFNLWQMRAWARFQNDQDSLKQINHWATDFFDRSYLCKETQENNLTSFLSPCFMQINLMYEVLEPKAFKSWTANHIISPKWIENLEPNVDLAENPHRFGIAPSRLMILGTLKNSFPTELEWSRAYDKHLKAVMSNLPIWKDDYNLGHWVGQLSILALSSEYNSAVERRYRLQKPIIPYRTFIKQRGTRASKSYQ